MNNLVRNNLTAKRLKEINKVREKERKAYMESYSFGEWLQYAHA